MLILMLKVVMVVSRVVTAGKIHQLGKRRLLAGFEGRSLSIGGQMVLGYAHTIIQYLNHVKPYKNEKFGINSSGK